MKSKTWIIVFLVITIIPLSICAIAIYYIDPYFHYHKPHTDKFFYTLDNERSQNDGVIKHFDYEGLITGTSMCENFKVSEAEGLFDVKFIKVPFSGATYKEINDNIEKAINYNPNLKIVIRGLDMNKFIEDKDLMRNDLGEYPSYLYDENLMNDVKYLFNKDVLYRVFNMINGSLKGEKTGLDSFDDYGNWMKGVSFGSNAKGFNSLDRVCEYKESEQLNLTEDEKNMVLGSVEQNIISIANNNPDVTFYLFFTPYSAMWWKEQLNDGNYLKQIEAERIIIEELLGVDNIKLFSINDRSDITTDLNNYKDHIHYGEWINSLLLKSMSEGKNQLTIDNYKEYIGKEKSFYETFDYSNLWHQIDYEDDTKVVVLQSEL